MTEAEKSEYLDRLVLTYLHQNNPLTILEAAPDQERPKIFLERIGWGQQKDYTEDALNAYLTTSSPPLPQGQIYVFTPIDSFRYDSTMGRVTHAGVRNGSSDDSTNDALNEILEQLEAKTGEIKTTLAHILFFDEKSLKKFENALKTRLQQKNDTQPKDQPKKEFSYSAEAKELNITNYGKVKLHDYAIKSSPQPSK